MLFVTDQFLIISFLPPKNNKLQSKQVKFPSSQTFNARDQRVSHQTTLTVEHSLKTLSGVQPRVAVLSVSFCNKLSWVLPSGFVY